MQARHVGCRDVGTRLRSTRDVMGTSRRVTLLWVARRLSSYQGDSVYIKAT